MLLWYGLAPADQFCPLGAPSLGKSLCYGPVTPNEPKISTTDTKEVHDMFRVFSKSTGIEILP